MLVSSGRNVVRAMIARGRKSSVRRPLTSRKQRRMVEPLEARMMLAADPIISEFMANNGGVVLDGDGNSSDWIEIYNKGDEAIDLLDWKLSDSNETWSFPSRVLNVDEFLVVFASNQAVNDYIDPAGNLHTTFALSSGGEYLALLRPDLSVASEFTPEFPSQPEGFSYGSTMQTLSVELVGDAASVSALVPAGPVVDWTGGNPSFDDSGWTDGTTGVGYADETVGTPGLVAQWTFETAGGTPIVDDQTAVGVVDETAGDVGGAYDGVGSGIAGTAAAGLFYEADVPAALVGSTHSLVFPAPENPVNRVAIPLDADHPIAKLTEGDFRIEAWFKTTDTGRNVLIGSHTTPVTSLNLELHTGNRGRLWIQGPGATTDLNVTLPTDSRDGQWHHLAGVREGATASIYYDGQLVGSQADVAGSYVLNKPFMYLGSDSRTGETIFNGSLDNVNFYNSADTSSLVATYEFETSGGTPVTAVQDGTGPVDDTGAHLDGPFSGTGSSAGGANPIVGLHYEQDVDPLLSDSTFSLAINEANTQVESVNIGMPQAIADLTLGDFTLQTRFKTIDAGRSVLMGSYNGTSDALNLELHTGNRLRVYIQNVGVATTDLNLVLPSDSRDGQWHSVAAVRRGSDVELYFDGVLVGGTNDVAGSYTQTASDFYFGRDNRIGDTQFDGSLDNVRMWSIALSSAQIAAMAGGATPAEVTGSALAELISTDIETDLRGVNPSALIRIPFNVVDPATIGSLLLKMKYDDGFVAYINGTEVARSGNVPDPLLWNSAATSDREFVDVLQFENFNIFSPQSVLLSGENILAIQGLNADVNDTEFLILPQLFANTTTVEPETRFFSHTTPGEPNDPTGVIGFVSDTGFSVDRGFYDRTDLFSDGVLFGGVRLTTNTPGATIRYTIDGSWPTASYGTVYTTPVMVTTTTTLRAIAVLDDYQSSNVDTQTYIFLDDVIRQPANPGPQSNPAYPLEFPLTHQPGVAANYEMDTDVVRHALYASTIRNDLMSIPTMSIVMDMDDIFNQPNGIWSNSQQDGLAWERLASIEYFDPNNPDREFQLNSAIRMQGRAARNPSSSIKHSFRLIFKDTYGLDDLPTGGPTKLDFPLFENSPVSSFDTVTLRGGYNYSYNHNTDAQNQRAQFIRERFMRESQLATGQLASSGTYVHLYVNGLYFGLYAPQERPDASFMAEHLDGNKSNYDIIGAGQVKDGDALAWNELLSRASQNLSVKANYDAVVRMTDVDSLIDYFIVHLWGGTTDWPTPGGQQRNWYTGRERGDYDTSGNGFKFFVWDAEYSIQGVNDNVTGVNDSGSPAYLYARMQANPEFRIRFADRLQEHFFDDGALTPEQNIARYTELADFIDRAIVGESARWGDTHPEACGDACLRDPLWVAERDWILNTYMPGRTDTVLAQFANIDLYPSAGSVEYFINDSAQHGGDVVAGSALTFVQRDDEAGANYIDTKLVARHDDVGATRETAQVLIAPDDSLGTLWTATSFVPDAAVDFTPDVTWTDGTGGIGVGYEAGIGYADFIDQDVIQMPIDGFTDTLIRINFNHDGTAYDRLQLKLMFDDGFIAYLNGVEVARSANFSAASDGYDAAITTNHEADPAFEDFDISAFISQLVVGDNLLAIHGINRSTISSDFLILPELVGGVLDVGAGGEGTPVWFTTDGSDPRSEGGAINDAANGGTATLYSGQIILAESTRIKARALSGGEWSALSNSFYTVQVPLRITELNYHPVNPTQSELDAGFANDDDFEFIELLNTSTVSVPLAGIHFDGSSAGVEFTFDVAEPNLPAGERIVVVRNQGAFAARYDTSSMRVAIGSWEQSGTALSNGGDLLTLNDAGGGLIQTFTYSDDWLKETDGDGFSLVPIDTTGNYDIIDNWRSSAWNVGSPGLADPTPAVGDFDGNGMTNRSDIVTLLQQFGRTTNSHRGRGDVNLDGRTSLIDLAGLQTGLGDETTPLPPTGPAPSAAPSALLVDVHFSEAANQPRRLRSTKSTIRRTTASEQTLAIDNSFTQFDARSTRLSSMRLNSLRARRAARHSMADDTMLADGE